MLCTADLVIRTRFVFSSSDNVPDALVTEARGSSSSSTAALLLIQTLNSGIGALFLAPVEFFFQRQ
jgi:hypothetical protein